MIYKSCRTKKQTKAFLAITVENAEILALCIQEHLLFMRQGNVSSTQQRNLLANFPATHTDHSSLFLFRNVRVSASGGDLESGPGIIHGNVQAGMLEKVQDSLLRVAE